MILEKQVIISRGSAHTGCDEPCSTSCIICTQPLLDMQATVRDRFASYVHALTLTHLKNMRLRLYASLFNRNDRVRVSDLSFVDQSVLARDFLYLAWS